ncbi:MAG: hypothetical protein JSW60_01965 [Thermoplasmatales archaeon]|nr:MAG: hypothetical protein JSW60_01965 [Thermoplasmatales archaeon]
MKKKIIGILFCMLLMSYALPVSGTSSQSIISNAETSYKNSLISYYEDIGISGGYKSMIDISSPEGKNYTCIMFCNNHEQTLDWIYNIDEFGFEKAWFNNLIKLTIFYIMPGTVLWFGLHQFREWYSDLFIKLRYKDDFLDFLNNYDEINGTGMITYSWLSGFTNRPIDFKSQPDNSWIEDSWILDEGGFIPNPEIWGELFFWYFEIPPT